MQKKKDFDNFFVVQEIVKVMDFTLIFLSLSKFMQIISNNLLEIGLENSQFSFLEFKFLSEF